MVEARDEGAVEERLEVRAADRIGHFGRIRKELLALVEIIRVDPVRSVGRMLDEESTLAHNQILIHVRIEVKDPSAAQGMPVQQVHVYKDCKGVAVGADRGKNSLRIREIKVLRAHDLRRDEVAGADDLGVELSGYDEAVKIDDGYAAPGRIEEHVLIREIRVRKACRVEALHRLRHQVAHGYVVEPVAALPLVKKLAVPD